MRQPDGCCCLSALSKRPPLVSSSTPRLCSANLMEREATMKHLTAIARCITLLSLLSAPVASAQASKTIEAGEYYSLPIAFHSSSKEPLLKRAQLQQILDEKLAVQGSMKLKPLSDAQIEQCFENSKYGRMQCLTRAVRPEYSDALAKEARSSGELRQLLRAKADSSSRYLFVVMTRQTERGERLLVYRVDTSAALSALFKMNHVPGGITPLSIDKAEGDIIHSAIGSGGQVELEYTQQTDLAETLWKALLPLLAPAIEAQRQNRFAQLSIQTKLEGAEIRLGSRSVGATAQGKTQIVKLRPGQRKVTISHPGYEAFSQSFVLKPGQTLTLSPELTRLPNLTAQYTQQAVLWGGVAAAVAGGIILGLSFRGQDAGVTCFSGQMCEGSRFSAFSDGQGANGELQKGSVPMAPLGYSLIGMGATWSLGTLLFSDEDHIPWVEAVVGVVVGATSLGLSVALSDQDL